MDITYDHQIFSWQRYGGISRYFYELITRIPRLSGNPVSLFMGFHVNEYALESRQESFRRFFGVKHQLPGRLSPLVSLANRALFKGFLKSGSQAIYHPTYYRPLNPEFKGKRILSVYDMNHEVLPQYFPGDVTPQWKRETVASADGIICLSEHTKRDLLRFFPVPEEKIQVIYLANSLTAPVTAPPLVAGRYVLFVGTRSGYKNFPLLVQAFARLRKTHPDLLLVCSGGGAFNSEEESLFHSLGVDASVLHFQGPDEMLANLYRYASVFVYPSRYEGFGIPPLEAMHYGCPVLVSRSSSIPEVVGDAGLYFEPTDLEELTEQLKRILDSESLRQDLARRGHERERLFSWDRCARETLAFYRRIADA